jgi:membrane protein implicated in regulation of membrane protease activity
MLGEWWFWLSAAVVLGIVEVMVPFFVFLGFSIGAVGMAILVATGVINLGAAGNLALFAVLSLGGYALLRVVLGKAQGDVRVITKDINDN